MRTRSSSSASADLVPFVQSPAGHSREAQLQIVAPNSSRGKLLPGWTVVNRPRSPSRSRKGSVDTDHRSLEYASKGFRLPKGWKVEEFPRRNSSQIDKCYVEQKTGKRFRSLVSVERYLKEPGNHTDQQLMLLQYHRGHSKDFTLPDGWIVEGKPRRSSGHIDKSYIEPGTGNKFRSLAAVERYLNSTVNSDNSMVHSGRLSAVVFDTNPPKKVKWVLNGPGGNMFSAYVGGLDVSSSVKQTWSEAFVSLIQDRF